MRRVNAQRRSAHIMSEGEAKVANYRLNSERGQLNPVKTAMLFTTPIELVFNE